MKTDEHNCTLARGIEQTMIAAGVFLLGALSSRGQTGALPSPEHSGITHIVVVMMENRSFDHFLGWLPGADGQQAGGFLQHAAQTDRITNSTATSSLTTIWDRLASSGYTRRYYYVDLPFLALWGSKYLDIVKPFSTFLTDCQAGSLANVSFIDPKFLDENSGTSADDHPHADIRDGEQFLNQIYDAVRASPSWPSTVLVINYDEWGGFCDHVPPPVRLPVPAIQTAAGDLDGRLGFRVPCLVISPMARRGFVAKGQYDHTSLLKMIEWRFALAPLTERDRDANNLAEVLDFAHPNLASDAYAVPSGYVSPPCLP